MFLIPSLLAATIIATPPAEGFILPSLESDKATLRYVRPNQKPKLLWQRTISLYKKEDQTSGYGNLWIASNLLISLAPDKRRLFIPAVKYNTTTLEVGGTVLTNTGKSEELPKTTIPTSEYLALYYGWNESSPSIVEEHLNVKDKVHTFKNGKWIATTKIPASLRSLESPTRFMNSGVFGFIRFSDSWQCSWIPRRVDFLGYGSNVCMGKRGGRLAVSYDTTLAIFDHGESFSASFNDTENLLPLSDGRVVGRIIKSMKPRPEFSDYYVDTLDPFCNSEVFLFDLKNEEKTLLGQGIYGLPVEGDWSPVKQ